MRYSASFIGCTRGAIGIHHRIGTSVEATSPENARYKLYEAYDHIQDLMLTDANGVKSKPEKVSAT